MGFLKKNILTLYFIYIVFAIYVYSILQINEFPQKYVFTEWLINYQGGFIRRGLLGELIFNISGIFNIEIKFLILFFQLFFYSIYFIFYYLFFFKIKTNFFWFLIIFSPILFIYPLLELMSLGRKDILVITFFLIYSFINYKSLNSLFFSFLFFFGLSTFVHEITFFYIFHYLLIFYLNKEIILKKKISKFHIYIFLFLIIFLLYLNLYLHDEAIIENIVGSYNYSDITIYSGAFSHLEPSLTNVLLGTLSHASIVNIFKYLLIIILNSFPFLYFIKFQNIKFFSTKKIFILFFILSLPVYALVLDWGRVIYINHNFFIILLLMYFRLNLIDLNYLNRKIKNLSAKSKLISFILICLLISPDILSYNSLEYFPLFTQFLRFSHGMIQHLILLY